MTLFFSRGTPSIATVIPAMDHIDEHLAMAAPSTTDILSQSRPPSQSAKKLLTGAMTNQITLRCSGSQWVWLSYSFNVVSHLLLLLHPCHKLWYFTNAGWQDDWIEQAKKIVCTEFNLSYGSLDTSWATSWETQLSKAKVCVSNCHPI